jgi:nucleoid-associated protein YgaU
VPASAPAPAQAPGHHTYTVAPGDTLATIAQAKLGDANRYHEIFDLNRNKPQGDGGSLTDPTVIHPGERP